MESFKTQCVPISGTAFPGGRVLEIDLIGGSLVLSFSALCGLVLTLYRACRSGRSHYRNGAALPVLLQPCVCLI
jgi:hypothetical protein